MKESPPPITNLSDHIRWKVTRRAVCLFTGEHDPSRHGPVIADGISPLCWCRNCGQWETPDGVHVWGDGRPLE